ncbi:HD domain-containing protein [Halegenticoccus tardaugens]|uniref:HD domain-containing protein n=1 Tax=Halegenticoccus tardaugens TaxID=2071624 RepID=UPI00100C16AD|nr:HD domain-containing protein [Halegenticoccus tardaugens]
MNGDALDALVRAYGLKDERRTGWQLRGVADPESVAGHTWGVSLLCLVYADLAGVDAGRALELAVVHDLAEAETGDLPTRADSTAETVDPGEKERMEREAMEALAAGLDADEIPRAGSAVLDPWEEYEARETDEAVFVKEMDLVDMCLQALSYERAGRYDPDESEAFREYDDLDEFFATAEPRLRTELGRTLVAAIRARYEEAKRPDE